MHKREAVDNFLPDGHIDGAVELHSDREQAIWDRAQADAQEFLRGVSVRQGYAARGVRLQGLEPTLDEITVFFRKAKIAMGPFTIPEADLYSQAFYLSCQTGYPFGNN